jgi:hypothetical protein
MILRSPDRIAVLQEALDGAGKLAAVGVEDGEVVKPRVPLRWRCAALTLPRIQAYVVMVAPGGQESRSWQADVGTVDGDVEAKHLAVEGSRPLRVAYAQMHVPDAHRRVKL